MIVGETDEQLAERLANAAGGILLDLQASGEFVDSALGKVGAKGSLTLHHGFFPGDQRLVAEVDGGYALWLSKNTMKRGYVHPTAPPGAKPQIDLGDDAKLLVVRLEGASANVQRAEEAVRKALDALRDSALPEGELARGIREAESNAAARLETLFIGGAAAAASPVTPNHLRSFASQFFKSDAIIRTP